MRRHILVCRVALYFWLWLVFSANLAYSLVFVGFPSLFFHYLSPTNRWTNWSCQSYYGSLLSQLFFQKQTMRYIFAHHSAKLQSGHTLLNWFLAFWGLFWVSAKRALWDATNCHPFWVCPSTTWTNISSTFHRFRISTPDSSKCYFAGSPRSPQTEAWQAVNTFVFSTWRLCMALVGQATLQGPAP